MECEFTGCESVDFGHGWRQVYAFPKMTGLTLICPLVPADAHFWAGWTGQGGLSVTLVLMPVLGVLGASRSILGPLLYVALLPLTSEGMLHLVTSKTGTKIYFSIFSKALKIRFIP